MNSYLYCNIQHLCNVPSFPRPLYQLASQNTISHILVGLICEHFSPSIDGETL